MMRLARLALFALALGVAAGASAETYPARPIRLVVPFPPGGPSDFFARGLGNAMKNLIDQPVIVDNRSGAAGMAGADNVAKSPPDGYSVVLGSPGSMIVSPSIADTAPFDMFRDFTPVVLVVTVPEAVVVTAKLELHTLDEFVSYAKAHPGKLNMASTGSGGMPHLAGELLKREAGFQAVHVPYRGAAPAVSDLLSGQADFMFADLPVLMPHLDSGKLIGLALGSNHRSSARPDLPTTVELGFPTVLADNWYGLFVPAATPPEVVAKLTQVASAALQDPALQAMYLKFGGHAESLSGPAFAAFVRAEGAKWSTLAKAVGARLD